MTGRAPLLRAPGLSSLPLVALLLEACCHCPSPVVQACPPTGTPPARPAAAQAPAAPPAPSLRLPRKLGPARSTPPSSLEALLKALDLRDGSFAALRDALEPYIGGRVRWTLRSWGGEMSTVGYQTPSGLQPVKIGATEVGRIRLISTTLGEGANLGTVIDAGHPVVTCLALFPADDDPRLARSDDRRVRAPDLGIVTIEGTIWGATREGRGNLWLHDCAVVDP